MDDDNGKEDVLQEVEMLKAIYESELTINYDTSNSSSVSHLSIDINPSTADDASLQYVFARLLIHLDSYPLAAPQCQIGRVRGLDEHQIRKLKDLIMKAAQDGECDAKGGYLYGMIQAAKDFITKENHPNETCVICLHGFDSLKSGSEKNVIRIRPCYHFLHSSCFSRYLMHARKQAEINKVELEEKLRLGLKLGDDEKERGQGLLCPVCRCAMELDTFEEELKLENDMQCEENTNVPSASFIDKKKIEWMQHVYKKQMSVGGIIGFCEWEKDEIHVIPSIEPATTIRTNSDVSSNAVILSAPSQRRNNDSKQKQNALKTDKLPLVGGNVGINNVNKEFDDHKHQKKKEAETSGNLTNTTSNSVSCVTTNSKHKSNRARRSREKS